MILKSMRRTSYALPVIGALAILWGCGGGGGQLAFQPVSDTVSRLAGTYQFGIISNGAVYTINLNGASNSFSGSGHTTVPTPTDYSYTGFINNDGSLTARILVPADARYYDITARLSLDTDGFATGSGTSQSSLGATASVNIARNNVTPVSSGPVNSLVGAISLSSVAAGSSRGMAVSPDGATLYTYAGGQVRFVKKSDGTVTRSVPLSDTPLFMAASADGNWLYIAGSTVSTLNTQTGVLSPLTFGGSALWLTAPTATSAGSNAYFGASNGVGYQISVSTVNNGPIWQQLRSLGTTVRYDAAAISRDNSRLLVSSSAGAAAVGITDTSFYVAPFTYASLSGTASPAAASSDGHTLYTVSAGSPPNVYKVNVDAKTLLGSVTVGTATTLITDAALSPDGTRLVLVAANSRAYVLDTVTMKVLSVVDVNLVPEMGAGAVLTPPRVAISADGSRAYVSGQNSLAVIRLQ